MNWPWRDYWDWFRQIEKESDRKSTLDDLEIRWINNLSMDIQVEVFKFSPEEVKNKFAEYLKPEARKKLGIETQNLTQMDIKLLFGTRTRF